MRNLMVTLRGLMPEYDRFSFSTLSHHYFTIAFTTDVVPSLYTVFTMFRPLKGTWLTAPATFM